MILPTIHANGTAPEAIYSGAEAAFFAADALVDALRKMTPNGRDYYPQGEDAIVLAGKEHAARIAAVQALMGEIQKIMEVSA